MAGESRMSRVIAVVEGQTEQGFVRDVLAPFLSVKNVFLSARLVGKPGHKGGDCRYDRAKRDVLALLRQESDTIVTTMFDFYALPDSWPGRTKARAVPFLQKAGVVEAAVKDDILGQFSDSFDAMRFRPYVQMHEFEALLFSRPAVICSVLRSPNSEKEMQDIRRSFQNPEEINDNPATAPSKRILNVFADYRKRLHGLIAAQRIGINAMREVCPHFCQWVRMLESIG
jgi:hypothetical protein